MPLDDCLYTLQAIDSALLALSATPLCPTPRHQSPALERAKPAKRKFKDYLIDYLNIGFAEVQPEEGRQYIFVVISRISKLAFADCFLALNE